MSFFRNLSFPHLSALRVLAKAIRGECKCFMEIIEISHCESFDDDKR
jgi:hypothetical protein